MQIGKGPPYGDGDGDGDALGSVAGDFRGPAVTGLAVAAGTAAGGGFSWTGKAPGVWVCVCVCLGGGSAITGGLVAVMARGVALGVAAGCGDPSEGAGVSMPATDLVTVLGAIRVPGKTT